MENLYRTESLEFPPYTAKGTIKNVKFDVPSGFKISNVLVVGRFQTSSLAGFKSKNYKIIPTHFSYSYDAQGNVWVSNVADTESDGRLAEILVILSRS